MRSCSRFSRFRSVGGLAASCDAVLVDQEQVPLRIFANSSTNRFSVSNDLDLCRCVTSFACSPALGLHHLRLFSRGRDDINLPDGGSSNKRRRLQRAIERSRKSSIVSSNKVELHDGTLAISPQEQALTAATANQVVGRSALIVARPIEWGQVLFGFEQSNRYTVYDENGAVVAHLLEEEGSLGRAIGRQLLRTRRPFFATIVSVEGTEVLFRLRRPAYLINSTMFVEDGEGNQIGEIQQRWHPWRRRYDLFIGKHQFAAIDGGLLAWEFVLKDAKGGTLALIDRNFSGFGKEFFTDAGKYVIHFGESPMVAAKHLQNSIHAAHPDQVIPPITALAKLRTNVDLIPTSEGNQLVVQRSLMLSERLIALAAAISIDYDYFSRHSYSSGFLSPFIHPPVVPFPVPNGAAVEEEGEETGVGSESMGATSAAGAPDHAKPDSTSERLDSLEQDLGGDSFDDGMDHYPSLKNEEYHDQNDDDAQDGDEFSLGDIMDVFGWGDEE